MDGTRARAVLGVSTQATARDIQFAFRQQAKQLHPDLGSSDADAFRRLVRARDVLLAEAHDDHRPIVAWSIAHRFEQPATHHRSNGSWSDVARRVPTATSRVTTRTFGDCLEAALAG